MAFRSTTTRRAVRPQRENYRSTSQRGSHNAGNNFTNARIATVSVSGPELTLTFDMDITVTKEETAIRTNLAANPIGIAQTGCNTCVITFDDDVDTAENVLIPRNDPAIRTVSGGWAESPLFPVVT